jgi:hypothetical protein
LWLKKWNKRLPVVITNPNTRNKIGFLEIWELQKGKNKMILENLTIAGYFFTTKLSKIHVAFYIISKIGKENESVITF